MGWTKKEFIEQAFDQIGLAGYVYDLTPGELQSALRALDTLLATWQGRGIPLSYSLASSPSTSQIDDVTNVPDRANEAVHMNLAIRLAPSFGKKVSIETKASAKAAYQVIMSHAAQPQKMQFPDTLPRGAGNKPWRLTQNPFMDRPLDRLDKTLPWLVKTQENN